MIGLTRYILALMAVAATVWCGACASTLPAPDDPAFAEFRRQGELARLFDRVGSADAAAGEEAAREFVALPAQEQGHAEMYWLGRSGEPALARRLGAAYAAGAAGEIQSTLSADVCRERSLMWFRRALETFIGDEHRVQAAEVRYELACALFAADRPAQAVELLANRMDPRPLSLDLQAKYDALLDRIATAPPRAR